MAEIPIQFECQGCGRHIHGLASDGRPLCAACVATPGRVDDPELRSRLDPDCPPGGWPRSDP